MTNEHIAWSKRLFGSLTEGGIWSVPRSGLIFQKKGAEMHLINKMPFIPEMAAAADEGRDVPSTAEKLLEYQQTDFALIAAHFRAAGIEVKDQTTTKGN